MRSSNKKINNDTGQGAKYCVFVLIRWYREMCCVMLDGRNELCDLQRLVRRILFFFSNTLVSHLRLYMRHVYHT